MNIEPYKGKKIRIITSNNFTYVGYIISSGEDYINFRDKYDQIKFISLRAIDIIEEVAE